MSGAALFSLQDELNAQGSNSRTHLFRLMADDNKNVPGGDDLLRGLDYMRQSAALKKELIDTERDFIYQLLRDGKITDEARRRIEYELDLEEASVANRGRDGGGWM